jgi:hypothetical protein
MTIKLLLSERLFDLAEVSIQMSLFLQLPYLILGPSLELFRHLLRAVIQPTILHLLNINPHLHYEVFILGCEWHQI